MGVEDLILQAPTGWKGKVKNVFRGLRWKICGYYNRKQLEYICNLHPNYKGGLTSTKQRHLTRWRGYAKVGLLM